MKDMTIEVAYRAGIDAGDRSMREAGRKMWGQSDADLAVEVFNRLWPDSVLQKMENLPPPTDLTAQVLQ